MAGPDDASCQARQPRLMGKRVTTDGKFFAADEMRFIFRGWYHPAADDGTPPLAQLRECGFSVIVTETLDPELLWATADHGLHVLGEIRLPPWGDFRSASRREARQLVKGVVDRLFP